MSSSSVSLCPLALLPLAGSLISQAHAQVPVMIDVNPYSTTAADASPTNFARLGNFVLFSANDGVNGAELWITDGTAAGTVLLKDINPGSASSSPQNLTSFGSRVIFTADDGGIGRELWITDGTAAGTQLLKDVRGGTTSPGFSSAFGVIGSFGTTGSYVVFGANDGLSGAEPWVTDGTTAGTQLLLNISTNVSAISSNASGFFSTGGKVYFLANDQGSFGNELWSTDGNAAGTTRLTDIAPGTASSGYSLSAAANGWGYGVANNLAVGNDQEPTAINLANPAQVIRLADVRPGSTASLSQEFTVVGSDVLFRGSSNGTDIQLYKVTFDGGGTPNGVTLVADINPSGNDNVGNLAAYNGELYFAASDGTSGRELWKSNGTLAGTVRVADINTGSGDSTPLSLFVANNKLFFSATTPDFGRELFVSDGTTLGTSRLADLRQAGASGLATAPSLIELNSKLLFPASATVEGLELHASDGTNSGTTLVKDIRTQTTNTGSQPQSLVAVGNRLYFTATDEAAGREVWTSDGTAAGTVRVIDAQIGSTGSAPYMLTPFGSDLLFAANNGTGTGQSGIEYYKAAGTSASLIADISPGTGSSAPGTGTIGVLNGVSYFNATDGTSGAELWKYDGTNAPSRVADANPGSGGFNPSNFATIGNTLYFSAGFTTTGGSGLEPYRTDGTTISLVEDFNPGVANSSSPAGFFALGTNIFMRATATGTGSELAVYDTVANDLIFISDIRSGSASSTPSNFNSLNNELYFTATDSLSNIQLYTATATPGSATAKSNAIGSTATSLVKSGNFLYFAAGNLIGTNVQLWAFDGVTNGGQAFPITVNPSGGAFPTDLTDLNGVLYFAAVGATGGNELYRVTFDGSGIPNGAALVADLNAAGSSTPKNFRVVNGSLFFAADDGVHGDELWSFTPAPISAGCSPADIAYGDGEPLPPIGQPGGFNPVGPDGGDFDCFFNFYFAPAPDNAVCDIAYGDGEPLPPYGQPGGFNPGVDGGDFDCFFNYYFNGCL